MPGAPLPDFFIREATISDIPEILRQRRRMYDTPWPAHPYDLECRRATILNVYTDPPCRRRGVARALMQAMIAWCKQEGLARITLHATDQGRHLYESLGFEASNEMRLSLRQYP